MSEWWSYSLSDILMFSARTYYRQFELLNRELWPLQLAALAAGGFLLRAMLRPTPGARRHVFVLLGVLWCAVGWTWHAGRYADINTGAPYLAAAFMAQAVLLVAWGWRKDVAAPADAGARSFALVLLAAALAIFPLLAPLDGRSWWQAEVFGIAPDPTCAATLGALLLWRAPWFAWVIPLLWSAASGATLMELRAPAAWLLPGLALLAGAVRGARRRRI